jgi:hypothetical protein
VLFCVVPDSTIVTYKQKQKSKWKEPKEEEKDEESVRMTSLAYDSLFSYVHLHLAEVGPNDIGQALRRFRDIVPKQYLCLVKFPGVLLLSFQHTLGALQHMSRKPDIPFAYFIASTEQNLDAVEVWPPHYTTKPGFSFHLSCLTNDSTTLQHSPQVTLDPQQLSAHSTLDMTQSSALLNALLRCLTSIRGPPDTGKGKYYDLPPPRLMASTHLRGYTYSRLLFQYYEGINIAVAKTSKFHR